MGQPYDKDYFVRGSAFLMIQRRLYRHSLDTAWCATLGKTAKISFNTSSLARLPWISARSCSRRYWPFEGVLYLGSCRHGICPKHHGWHGSNT